MPSYPIFKKAMPSEMATQTVANNVIEKLHKSDRLEVGKYHLKQGAIFYIDINNEPDEVKTYTVLSGQLVDLKTQKNIETGDFLLIENIPDLVSLYATKETILLIHAQGATGIERFEQSNQRLSALLTELQQKDHYTKEHSDRVFGLVKKMALSLGYHSRRLYNLNKAARFHDIGKLYIDDKILNKPDRLTADEFETIKKHAITGEALILNAYTEDVFKIVAQHHERLNGSGYPLGLTGDAICEEAKILAICDCYDAMVTDRVYSKAKTHSEAISELKAGAGSLYDEKLVETFEKLF